MDGPVSRTVRAFRRSTEREIAERFGIVNPVTDAQRLLPAGRENSDAWLAARTATIGASEISVLMMTDHPYHSRFSLFHVKRNGWGNHPPTNEQERGHLLEPGIARRFAAAHPELVVARPNGALWRDPAHPHLSCTPDYLTIDRDANIVPLELKSDEGGDGWGPGPQEIPAHHWWQVQQQAGVFAAPHAWVARWSSRGYRDYLIDYDHGRYLRGAAEAGRFLYEVAAGHQPDPDAHRTTGAVLRDNHPYPRTPLRPVEIPTDWGEELAALKTTKAEVDKQIRRLDNRIRERLGDAAAGWDLRGRTYLRVQTRRRPYSVAATVVDQVRTRAPADEED